MIIQSPYDQWAIDYIVLANCKTNEGQPYSIENCNSTQRAAIQDYRKAIMKQIYDIKKDRKDVGIWGPACVQHGYSFDETLVNSQYKVPTITGKRLFEAIQMFL